MPPEASAVGAHLWPALRRLDELLARAVERSRELTGTTPGGDPFRGLYLAQDDVARSLTREPGEPLGIESQGKQGPGGVLAALAGQFGLSSFDVDLLMIALAPEVDLRYERVYAYLQDDVSRRRPSADLALSLLCGSPDEKLARRAHLAQYAPLVRYGLLELVAEGTPPAPLLARPLVVDEQIAGALLGVGGLDRRCAGFTTLSWPERSFDELPLDAHTRSLLERLTAHAVAVEMPLRLVVHGRVGAGHRGAAEAIAAAVSAPLVAADVGALVRERDSTGALRLLFRERWLRGGVLLLDGVDAFDAREHTPEATALASELVRDGGIVVLAGAGPWHAPGSEGPAPLALVTIELRPPDAEARRGAWAATGVDVAPADLDALAERFVLTGPQIREAAASASARGAGSTREGLFAEARAQSAGRLDDLAAKIAPDASWDDLVVPDDALAQLRELGAWVEHRQRVLGEWGFGRRLSRGRGATALFAGAAGTGKTLAAEVVAAELGLDLYRIDLSGIVSKYIGETEKNLDRIFRAAEDANAVLLFDEADALFGKRSEVHDSHDRYSNIEISYLLQKMEEYEGVAILATNLRDNLDQAFTRRLAFIVTFPFPEEEERRRIWELVWPAETPLADELDFDTLAAAHRLSGGQIRNAALAAAYLAAANGGEVSQEQVDHALRREYEKLGRAPRELEAVG
jgi:AAA+ superfamily predicted ATPase